MTTRQTTKTPNMTYVVTVDGGKVVSTQSSRTTIYTHALLATNRQGDQFALSFHENEDDAIKTRARLEHLYNDYRVVRVVRVFAYPYRSAKAKDARKAEAGRANANAQPLTLNDLHIGDHIRTRTGKSDAVVVDMRHISTPAEIEQMAAIRAACRYGSGPLPVTVETVMYRTLKDGKPFGPVRTARPQTLTLITP